MQRILHDLYKSFIKDGITHEHNVRNTASSFQSTNHVLELDPDPLAVLLNRVIAIVRDSVRTQIPSSVRSPIVALTGCLKRRIHHSQSRRSVFDSQDTRRVHLRFFELAEIRLCVVSAEAQAGSCCRCSYGRNAASIQRLDTGMAHGVRNKVQLIVGEGGICSEGSRQGVLEQGRYGCFESN